jgi:hypothetical protein
MVLWPTVPQAYVWKGFHREHNLFMGIKITFLTLCQFASDNPTILRLLATNFITQKRPCFTYFISLKLEIIILIADMALLLKN